MLMAVSYKMKEFDLEVHWPMCVIHPYSLPFTLTSRLAKTMLLAHGHVVKLYREEYQPKNPGKIGIALVRPHSLLVRMNCAHHDELRLGRTYR